MSGGKGGGGADLGPATAATNRAIDLQEKIYNDTKGQLQPWYSAGEEGLGRLMDLMGLGGGSVKTRDQVVKQLTPQYTRTVTNPATGMQGMYTDRNGMSRSLTSIYDNVMSGPLAGTKGTATPVTAAINRYNLGQIKEDELNKTLAIYGYTPTTTPGSTTSTVDYAALNGAVDNYLANQGTPDDFGFLTERFDNSKFEQDPGYQFRLEEGQKAVERAMAAQGKTLDPRALKAMTEYTQGYASNEYGNAYNRFNNDQTNLYNRLAGISGLGQTASAQMQQAGQNYANQASEAGFNLANAQMANQKSGGGSLFGDLANIGSAVYGAGKAYALFSDARLKVDVERIGKTQGISVYEFAYFWEPSLRYRGVMAQDIIATHPEAVMESPQGYLMVDYSQLPVKMERVCH